MPGIKKGVAELADCLLANPSDRPTAEGAERTRIEYATALPVILPLSSNWSPSVLTASALTGQGVSELWQIVLTHRKKFEDSGELELRRRRQAREWMWSLLEEGLRSAFRSHPQVASEIAALEAAVEARETTPNAAARGLLERFLRG